VGTREEPARTDQLNDPDARRITPGSPPDYERLADCVRQRTTQNLNEAITSLMLGGSHGVSAVKSYPEKKSYPAKIAEILRNAPRIPSFKRTPEPKLPGVSKETQAKLVAVHAANATFGSRGTINAQSW
jgi:hypothetical protein